MDTTAGTFIKASYADWRNTISWHGLTYVQQRQLVLALALDPWDTQSVVPFATRCLISMILPTSS